MRLRAMAKINLGLDVLRKREDGYHEVRMIMQTIQMYDLLDIRKKEEPGISLSTNLPYVPSDERNLVYKAAKLLMDEFDIQEGISMKLTKSIPVAAGMAGGSSDAAAAFVGVNKMFQLGLSEEELMKRAVQIGADVPYCIMRGTALAEGIGEKLTVLPPMPDCWILIGKPGISVSTKYVYTTHSELNAILNYNGGSLAGAKLYVSLFPCNECAKAIIQAGIKEVIYDCDKYADTAGVKASKRMMDAAGVRYHQYHRTGRKIEFEI